MTSHKFKTLVLLCIILISLSIFMLYAKNKRRMKEYNEVATRTISTEKINQLPPNIITPCPECGESSCFDEYLPSSENANLRICPRCSKQVPLLYLKANAYYSALEQNQ